MIDVAIGFLQSPYLGIFDEGLLHILVHQLLQVQSGSLA